MRCRSRYSTYGRLGVVADDRDATTGGDAALHREAPAGRGFGGAGGGRLGGGHQVVGGARGLLAPAGREAQDLDRVVGLGAGSVTGTSRAARRSRISAATWGAG